MDKSEEKSKEPAIFDYKNDSTDALDNDNDSDDLMEQVDLKPPETESSLNAVNDSELFSYQDGLELENVTELVRNPTDPMEAFSDRMELEHVAGGAQNDPMEQFSNRMGQIGRIAGGTVLQAGLMDKSIPAEEGATELLNMGTLGQAQLEALQSDKIASVPNEMKEAAAALASDPALIEREKKIIHCNEIVTKADSVRDVKSVQLSDQFFTKVDDLSKNIAQFADISTLSDEILQVLSDIEKSPDNPNDAEKTQLLAWLRLLSDKLGKLKDAQSSLSTTEQKFADVGWLTEAANSLKPLADFLELVDVRIGNSNFVHMSTADKAAIEKNFELVRKLSETLKERLPHWKSIESIIASRLAPRKINRQWTNGLDNGVSDVPLLVNDLRDPAMKELIPEDGVTASLEEGFKPLLKAAETLVPMDEKLKPISTPESREAVGKVVKVMKNSASVEATHAEAIGLNAEIFKCQVNHTDILTENDCKPVKELLISIDQLPGYLSSLVSFVKSQSLKEADIVEMQGIVQLSGDLNADFIESIEIRKKLMSGKLPKFKELIQKDDQLLTELALTDIKTMTDSLIQGKNTTATFLERKEVDGELQFHGCLQNNKDQLGKVSTTLESIQMARDFQDEAVLAQTVSTVQAVSKEIGAMKSIPDEMKKDENQHTTEMNKMPNAQETGKTIGGVSRGTVNAFLLKQGRISMRKLKRFRKMLPKNRNSKNFWRFWVRLQKGCGVVEAEIKKIERFASNLDPSQLKTLKDYGAAVASLKLGDVNVNIADLLNEFPKIISIIMEQADKDEAMKGTKALAQLNRLDLMFAKYQAAFAAAPAAFQVFLDFLQSFGLSAQMRRGNSESADDTMMIVFIVLGSAAFLSAAGTGIYFIIKCLTPKPEPEPDSDKREELKVRDLRDVARLVWMIVSTNTSDDARKEFLKMLDAWFRNLSSTDLNETVKKSFSRKDMRYHDIPVLRKGVVYVNKGSGRKKAIHANRIPHVSRGMCDDIAAQGPTKETSEDFLDMLIQNDVEYVVMLCKEQERDNNGVMRDKCDRYYPLNEEEKTVVKGDNVVTLLEIKLVCGENVCERKLEIFNKRTGQTHRLIHYHYETWPDHGTPEEPTTITQLHKLIEKNKRPVVVHCSAGVGRTMTFIGLRYMYHAFRLKCPDLFNKSLQFLRDHRAKGIQAKTQITFLIWALVLILADLGFDVSNPTTPEERERIMKRYPNAQFLTALEQARNQHHWALAELAAQERAAVLARRAAGLDEANSYDDPG